MKNDTAHVTQALDHINAIHDHLAKCEVYRGFGPGPVAASGLLGGIAAWVQPHFVEMGDARGFLRYWLVVGPVCAAIAASKMCFDFAFRDSALARRRTRTVVGQLVPCFAAGLLCTLAFAQASALVGYLPGLWALLFGLGIFATRPFAPRATGWMGLYFLAAGGFLLATATDQTALAGWRVGGVFALGQLASAVVLWINMERKVS